MPVRIFVVAAFLLAMANLPAVAAEDSSEEFSRANQLLFLEDHIVGSETPMVYRYDLDKSSTLEDESNFHDEITMTTRPGGAEGGKNVTFDYLSGARGKYMRQVEGARGNPILMMFLQRDVSEMDRLIGGDWRYFQKKIKIGLEQNAEIEPVTVAYNGNEVVAQRIKLKPFAGEQREEMQDYKDKFYEFTLSEEIPGEIYELRSVVPGDTEDAEPIFEERLVLKSAQPADAAASGGNN